MTFLACHVIHSRFDNTPHVYCRYGPPDYCCEHVMKLFGILLELDATHPSWRRTARVAGRMSSLLSESGARELQELLADFESCPRVALALSAADVSCFNDCFKSKVLDFCLSKLRAFSVGESLEFAQEALSILVQLRPKLREESAEDAWSIVTDVWFKMASRTYVASTKKWSVVLWSLLCLI